MATKKEYDKVVKFLLKQERLNLFFEDKDGFNAFDYAIAYGNYGTARILKNAVGAVFYL